VLDQIRGMEDNLNRSKHRSSLRARIHALELDRIRYLLSSYLRRRLQKIEKHVHCYVKEHDNGASCDRMSKEELQFAKDYQEAMEAHLRRSTLQHMSAKAGTADFDKIGGPRLDEFVFARVMRNCDSVVIRSAAANEANDDIVELLIDSNCILPYKSVAALISDRSVKLL